MTPELARSLSTPYLQGFNPFVIPYQSEVILFLRRDWDYALGTPEVLLSGSYGSAKSILMAHLAVTHCLQNPGGRVCLARKAMPDLKDTIFKEILEHISEDLIEGEDFWINNTRAMITFSNGSEIISRSWSDKKYNKGRSLKLSMLIFEELTENNEEDMQAFKTLKARLRRIPGIKENILIAATNPDSPAHWVHRYFMDEPSITKRVFYSVTTDNPFLDPIYIQQLMKDLGPREVDRYIKGMWVEVDKERLYYAYDQNHNRVMKDYEIDLTLPIAITWDFNIGVGKPLSLAIGQSKVINGNLTFHIFDQGIIEGARTIHMLEDLALRGLFENNTKFEIFGDATGKSRSTNAIHSNYEIIKEFLDNYKRKSDGKPLEYELKVPISNPPIVERHNKVNSYCLNGLGQRRLFVWAGSTPDKKNKYKCHKVDEGMRLTSLKKGASYIEDDSFDFQHVTTAIGYWVVKADKDYEYQLALRKAGL